MSLISEHNNDHVLSGVAGVGDGGHGGGWGAAACLGEGERPAAAGGGRRGGRLGLGSREG